MADTVPDWSRGEAWSWGESALVQPLSLARGLARLLQSQGVYVVEMARVVGIDVDERHVQVRVNAQAVIADDVIVASHSPVHDPDGHTMRMGVYQHAAVAVPVDRSIPASFSPDAVSTRPAVLPDGRPGAVVVGAGFRTGDAPADAWSSLEQWSASVLGSEPAAYRWIAQDLRSVDLLPFVGRTRRQRRVLVVTGLNAWGFTNAAAAAVLIPAILDADREETIAPLRQRQWAADRAAVSGGASDLATTAGWVTRSTVADHLRSLEDGHDLAPGQGRVVGGPFSPRAICRTSDGRVHAVSARCTHMGCLVRWNSLEESWDCPCHGSRFDPQGAVLEGPADRPLHRSETHTQEVAP